MLSFFHISGSIHPWNKKNRQLFKSQNAKGNKVCALFHSTTYGIIKFILIGSIQWEMQSMNKTEYTKAAGISKHDSSMGMLWYPTNHHNNLIVALLMLYL